jgi:N6-adenosine-specific RNA methylase IME4
MKFEVVVADCPWAFQDKLKIKDGVKRSAESQYQVMTLQRIKEMQIPFADDCVLALWCPSSLFFEQGKEVLDAWGFEPKQIYTWLKTTKKGKMEFAMGRWFRGCTEHAIIATKGKPFKMLKNKAQRNACLALNQGHSVKPDHLQDSLELMFPDCQNRPIQALIVLRKAQVFGNQITGRDIFEDLEMIKKLEV